LRRGAVGVEQGDELEETSTTACAYLAQGQRGELMRALTAGALAEGFATDLWTLPRVGELIKRRFTRSYSESQVWRILVSLGFSCQRPSGRALERDEGAIKRLCRKGSVKLGGMFA
jgi:transposase